MSEPATQVARQTTVIAAGDSTNKEIAFVPYGQESEIKMSIALVENVLAEPTKSGKRCSRADAIKFLMMCQASRLNPFAGDAFIVGYDGEGGPKFTLITAHSAFLKRAELHPDFRGLESGVIVQEGVGGPVKETEGDFHLDHQVLLGAWARVVFRGDRLPVYRKIKLSTFVKPTKIWRENPNGMIVKCAEADALRSAFPSFLGGLYTADEMPEGDGKRPLPRYETGPRQIADSTPVDHPRRPSEPSRANDDDGDFGPSQPATQERPEPDQLPDAPASVAQAAVTPEPPKKPKLSSELMAKLDIAIGEHGDAALSYCRQVKWLKDGETLADLTDQVAKQILGQIDRFREKIGAEVKR